MLAVFLTFSFRDTRLSSLIINIILVNECHNMCICLSATKFERKACPVAQKEKAQKKRTRKPSSNIVVIGIHYCFTSFR